MDIKSIKLIMYMMKMNNAHQLKLKYSKQIIVNLEIYASVCIQNYDWYLSSYYFFFQRKSNCLEY